MSTLSEVNWQLVLILAVTSAAVSYLGDIIGKKIGKRRSSVIGLRPKHAATLIAVLTGVAVAVITIAASSIASSRVRHAFFGVNYLDRQISQLTVDVRDRQYQLDEMEIEVHTAREELEKLRREARELEEGLGEMKGKRVIAFGGEVLAQTVIDGSIGREELDAAISELIRAAHDALANPGDPRVRLPVSADVVVSDAERLRLADEVAATEGRRVLRMSVPSNVVIDQPVECVIDLLSSRLIYREGDFLVSASVSGKVSSEEAIDMLYTTLRRLNGVATAAGVLSDPHSGSVGSVGADEFYSLAEKIASGESRRMIEVYADRDIYSEGPVKVRVKVHDAEE